jgi:hypothetical protein
VGVARLVRYGLLGSTLHERTQTRKMYPHAPADPRRLELSATDIAPQGRVRQTGVAFRLRVADPLLLYRPLQQLRPFLEVLDGARDQATMCRMAAPQNDTSKLRAWLASQLKLEDIPDPIWSYLVEERYVTEAQDPDYPDAREKLVTQARKLLRIHRAGANAPEAHRRRRTKKRQSATATSRFEAVAEIGAKIDEAKASRGPNASHSRDEEEHNTPTPEEWTQRTAHFLGKPDLQELGRRGIKIPKRISFDHADSPLMGKISNNQITVRAEPWVSPEAVRRKFESLRNVWFWKPTPSERRVELVRFITEFCEGYYNEEHGITGLRLGSSWRGIMEQWNQRYPQEHDWHYLDVRNFRRDFNETFETLTSYKDF